MQRLQASQVYQDALSSRPTVHTEVATLPKSRSYHAHNYSRSAPWRAAPLPAYALQLKPGTASCVQSHKEVHAQQLHTFTASQNNNVLRSNARLGSESEAPRPSGDILELTGDEVLMMPSDRHRKGSLLVNAKHYHQACRERRKHCSSRQALAAGPRFTRFGPLSLTLGGLTACASTLAGTLPSEP